MNAKTNIFKSAIGVGVLSLALATPYAANSLFVEKEQPRVIVNLTQPLQLDELDIQNGTAYVLTSNDEYGIEVEYSLNVFHDGNGYESWNDAQIQSINEIKVFNEDGEVKDFHIDSQDVAVLAHFIETNIQDRV